MTSFISTLSLLILVFSNGCFTLPFFDGRLSNSTSSSVNNYLTTGETSNLQFVNDNVTTVVLNTIGKSFTDEYMGFEVTTSMDHLSGEKSAQALRFDEHSTSEPMTITTEQSYFSKHDADHLFPSSLGSMVFTTEQSQPDRYNPDHLSLTSVHLDRRNFNDFENGIKSSAEEMPVELTTNHMSLFTSTPSANTPKLYTSESSSVVPKVFTQKLSNSTSTSTGKYVGLLKDGYEQEEEYEQESSTKYIKPQRKTLRKSQVSSTRRSELYPEQEDNSSIPTAVWDQQALDKVPNLPNDFLMLDESNDLVVTDLPRKTLQTTVAYKEEEERPLNQGKKSSHPQKKEPDY